MNAQCLISFGSNLGDRDQRIADAAAIVSQSPLVKNFLASRLFETPPIGGPGGQEPFLNAVAAFDTTATAREVLELLQDTENRLGRLRRQRWGARSIDLDVVLHGELIGGSSALVVPHPRYTARQFVLQPACDVAPHYRDPRFGWTIEQLSCHLSKGAASLSMIGGEGTIREDLCQRLEAEHGVKTFTDPETDPAKCRDHASWVSSFVPPLPMESGSDESLPMTPRLIVRIQRITPATCWPAPHQMWPAGGRWPEYRLEVDDQDWAVTEIVSALASMRCPIRPVTADGSWAGSL
ncbi:2-amino-4-hydroxy-6-hydroxymethyldihydropteridine diphosphokinase [Rubripirellula reticaptiva]|uniref:2-amino-4-hydroxy-6-hydroxymethyldihydropteridine pyrophosphokinase n=1 Tax=Rubripirellula reticaptiva TaxID=2528013 RepID=A0A5C6EM35_9BACT|nr:2-amino-4-hydroxy-6-hydroxymethyldihydropteridine diphosphokinase [Rubripirellula reticaptiva]TWU49555.1 2-amino-4-hydroxy-6-hydroxymethyldihydropteridine pyrophosphokinase [Rubripirellula reticaptiva]